MNLKSFADPLLVPDDKEANKSVFRRAAETPERSAAFIRSPRRPLPGFCRIIAFKLADDGRVD